MDLLEEIVNDDRLIAHAEVAERTAEKRPTIERPSAA